MIKYCMGVSQNYTGFQLESQEIHNWNFTELFPNELPHLTDNLFDAFHKHDSRNSQILISLVSSDQTNQWPEICNHHILTNHNSQISEADTKLRECSGPNWQLASNDPSRMCLR